MRIEAGRHRRGRAPGPPPAGDAGFQRELRRLDRRRPGDRRQRERAVARAHHRQGIARRAAARHGGHHPGRHRRQAARRLPQHRPGARDQRPDLRRRRHPRQHPHPRYPARHARRTRADRQSHRRLAHQARRAGAHLRRRPGLSPRIAGGHHREHRARPRPSAVHRHRGSSCGRSRPRRGGPRHYRHAIEPAARRAAGPHRRRGAARSRPERRTAARHPRRRDAGRTRQRHWSCAPQPQRRPMASASVDSSPSAAHRASRPVHQRIHPTRLGADPRRTHYAADPARQRQQPPSRRQ